MNKLNQDTFNPLLLKDKLGYREAAQISTKLTVRIDEDIKSANYYSDVIERMRELTENDQVEIIINTDGGSLQGTLAIINAINNCEANVVGIIEGDCASGGSAIALSCPNIAVSPYGTMMIHCATGFTGGNVS